MVHGYSTWPPLCLLEEKYPRGAWRKHDSNLNSDVVKRKIITEFMPTPAARDAADRNNAVAYRDP